MVECTWGEQALELSSRMVHHGVEPTARTRHSGPLVFASEGGENRRPKGSVRFSG